MEHAPAAPHEPKQKHVFNFDRQVAAVRFSPCGKFLCGGGFDGLVRRLEVSAGEPVLLNSLAGHNGWVTGLAFAGDQLLTADSWGAVRCWRYADEKPEPKWIVEAAHDGWIHDLTVSGDGQQFATCGADRQVRTWSVADGKPVRTFVGHAESALRVKFHPGGQALVSGDLLGSVRQWDLATGNETRQFAAADLHLTHRLQETGGVRSLAFDAAGSTLSIAGTQPANGNNVQGTPTILLFDWATGALKEKLQFGAVGDVYVTDVLFHADGLLIAGTCGGPGVGKLVYLKPGTKEPLRQLPVSNCHSLSLHPGGKLLAANTTNNGSNGNGRSVTANGEYAGNYSPIVIYELA